MQRFELLGGKYQQGEQIVPGAIQSFRGYELPTGRPVFIHRALSKEPAALEMGGLLSAGLIRSAAVRKVVLDVYESELYRFVVTEPDRQCVPLRDWLERETGEPAEAFTGELKAAVAPLPIEPDSIAGTEETRVSPAVEATEFARMFRDALAGKREKARRDALRDEPAIGYGPTGQPALLEKPLEEEPLDQIEEAASKPRPIEPLKRAEAPVPELSETPELFSRVGAVEKAGRSTLIVFLVVLGVVVVLLVMFVVIFVKR